MHSGNGFDPSLFDSPADAERLHVRLEPASGPWGDPDHPPAGDPRRRGFGRHDHPARPGRAAPARGGDRDPDRSTTASTSRARSHTSGSGRCSSGGETQIVATPGSNATRSRRAMPNPIKIRGEDVATPSEVGGSVWSRLFPFLLVIMALTGAFYPAVDLCAGEKERGTMETLLISPASRSEIVMGKFLTVMLASVMTALLNLVSMGLTGIADGPACRRAGCVAGPACRRGRGGHPRRADPPGGALDVRPPDPAGRLLRRRLRGAGRAGAEHEGGPVLHDAPLPGQHAPDLPVARRPRSSSTCSTASSRSQVSRSCSGR